jgi:acyl-[acyl-carrier-protein]-phospholipid O-acyltransferase / long-chain-fatty-acid--[acyl-carrier-protein] ligase
MSGRWKCRLLSLLWRLGGTVIAVRYKIVTVGTEHVPGEGAVLLLGNHVSWLDWMLVQLPLRRRIRFMMDRHIYAWKGLNWMFRLGRTIPVSPNAPKSALSEAGRALHEDEAVAIFPEGGITRSCKTEKFYRGFEIIASRSGTGVIVPFYIDGMCGSCWSPAPGHYTEKKALFRRRVTVVYGAPMPRESAADEVRERVMNLKEFLAEQT